MRIQGLGMATVVLLLAAIFLLRPLAYAQNAEVTIGVGDNILTVSGRTSPNAFVTISRDGGVIGTTTADGAGAFTQTFPAQNPGLHQLSVFAHTTGGANTDTVAVDVNITEHATTQVSIFLPSTLVLDDTNLAYGQHLVVSGEAAPSSTVAIYIDNATYATTTTNTQGLWGASLDTGALSGGQHQVFVRVTDGFGEQSYPTTARFFSTAAKPAAPGESSVSPVLPPRKQSLSVPVITFPAPGTIWQQSTITIKGTADPRVQIELWNETEAIGSVWSDGRGQWSMPIKLEPQAYALRARACIEQTCSGFSATTHFTYEPTGPISPLARPLRIRVPQTSFTIYQNTPLTLRALVLDGQPPYKLIVQWNEHTSEELKFLHDELSFTHTYAKPGTYEVAVDVEDSQGRTNRIYFSIHVKADSPTPFFIGLFAVLALAILAASLILYRHQRKRKKSSRK